MMDVRSREYAVPFLQRLIAVNTCNPPGNEHRLSVVLEPFLNEARIPCEIVPLDSKRSNVTAALKGSGRRRLMFCGHLDTVSPWSASAGQYAPHGAEIRGNRIYGRGASDMKSGLAAMMLAMASLRQDGIRLDGDLLFLATAGEEVDSCGARRYLDRNRVTDLDGMVIGEPTSGKIALGHKGALWLRITLYGKSAHGSMPEFGLNAVEGMMELIALLRRHAMEWRTRHPVLGDGSLSVNRIAGGVQTNVIPDQCTIDIDIRTVPPQNHASLLEKVKISLDGMKKLNPQYRYKMELLLDRIAVHTDPNDELITAALEITGQSRGELKGVPYYTDGSVLHQDGKPPILIYGPGDEKLAHQPDEWVDIDAYVTSISFYRELAIRFLGTEQA